MVVEKQKKTISALLLEEEVTLLKSKLDKMTKYVCMLNNDSDMLDEILEEKMSRNMKGIRFDYNSMNK